MGIHAVKKRGVVRLGEKAHEWRGRPTRDREVLSRSVEQPGRPAVVFSCVADPGIYPDDDSIKSKAISSIKGLEEKLQYGDEFEECTRSEVITKDRVLPEYRPDRKGWIFRSDAD